MSDPAKSEKYIKEEENRSNRPRRASKFPDILGGVIFIAIGIILLFNNFNIISWSFWGQIARFWPVIIIFIGLDIFSGTSLLLRLTTTLIGIAIVIFVVCYGLTAVDYRVRNYLYRSFPLWEKIYSMVPKKEIIYFEKFFEDVPDFRLDRNRSSWN